MNSPSRESAARLINQTFPLDGKAILTNVDRAVVSIATCNVYKDSSVSPEEFELLDSVYHTMSNYKEVLPELEDILIRVCIAAAKESWQLDDVAAHDKRLDDYVEVLYRGLIEDVMESDVYA